MDFILKELNVWPGTHTAIPNIYDMISGIVTKPYGKKLGEGRAYSRESFSTKVSMSLVFWGEVLELHQREGN